MARAARGERETGAMTSTEQGSSQSLKRPVATRQRIVVRDLNLSVRVGVTPAEREQRQRLRIAVELEVEAAPPRADSIAEVVDYGQVVGLIRQVCRDSEVRLLETLAQDIAEACFFDARVRASRIRIEKLDRYPDVGGIGIELEHRR